ncbi:MAG TPA: SLC13 family permease [Gammaproteobacteria bacterium]|jgi:di/tricarboxylate transporter
MSLAWVSVAALAIAVALSCTTAINVGVLSLAFAMIIGVFFAGLEPAAVLAGFPTDLLFMLLGVTLLFAIAETNGTLARVTASAVRLCRGRAGVLPIMFFFVGFALATIGAGATPASALLAPPAMAVASRAGIRPFLMALMAGNGALAGTLSPFAPTGVVADGVMARIGLAGVEWQTFLYNALAHAFVGFGGFLLFGGWKLFRGGGGNLAFEESRLKPLPQEPLPQSQVGGAMERAHWLTVGGIVVFIVAVAGVGLDVGIAGLSVATVLILVRAGDEAKAIQRMPWGVILMVTGVTVLIALLRETQGLALITDGIGRIATAGTVHAIVAFAAGLVSVYSSTSGVVLPAFLPMAPPLAQQLGIDPLAIAWSMNVSASLVDLSSLSTVGALFIAGAAGTDVRKLFMALLAWGLAMAVVGAALCWVLFG